MSDFLLSRQGPEQIFEADTLTTSEPDGSVLLRIEDNPDIGQLLEPISVPGLLIRAANMAPDITALAVKRDNQWMKWTYQQYLKGNT